MASNQELTDQVIALSDQVQTLATRLLVAEGNVTMQAQGGSRGGEGSVFDKKRLYPKELKDNTSFRSWSERFIAWLSMDNEEIGQAFLRAGKQDDPLDVSGLTVIQLAYSKAVYGHLRALTEGYRKASKIIRLVRGENGLEAWRKLVRKFDPQNAEVHAAQLEHIVTYGTRNPVKSLGDVPTALDQFQRVLDD